MTRLILALVLLCCSVSTTAVTTFPPTPLAQGMQFQCLAITAFTEARDQGERGMALVVHTILQRAQAKQSEDFCEIAARSYDGFTDWRTRKLPWKVNPEKWDEAVLASSRTLEGYYDFASCTGATHYFNPGLARPYWARKLEHLCTYKDHAFYVERTFG